MISGKEQSNRAGLTIAVIGLSITTILVLVVGFFFVSSLMLWRKPQPVVAASLPMEQEPQTAVSKIVPATVAPQVSPTLTTQPTRVVTSEEVAVEEVEETAVSPPATSPLPQIETNSAEAIQFGELIIPSLNVSQLVTTVPLQDGQ